MTTGPVLSARAPAAAIFRPDLNALRAWAVLAVVLYHFNIAGFASGFVGVDIFFVISGYLITGQALAQLEAGRFSFRAFWTARLRRIFPALMVMVLVTVFAGWWLTMPDAFLRHIRQMLFAVTFLSNITFDDARGYFDTAAQTKPLLHTWSLSIEWQFYLVLPLLLAAAWRLLPAANKPLQVLVLLLLSMLLSMAWCCHLAQKDAGAAFFSLGARAWELQAGAVVAVLHRLGATALPVGNGRVRAALVVLGWSMVLASAVAGLSAQHWPGPWTLLPVLGCALVVWGGPLAALRGVTDNRLVQRLGDWSYSIYLWHWPVWVFVQQWAGYSGLHVGGAQKAGALATALVLSYLSYRYVESATRSRPGVWTAPRLWRSYCQALAGLTAFTLAAVSFHGFPQRVPDYQQRVDLALRVNTPHDECFRNAQSEKRDRRAFCSFGALAPSAGPGAMLWGDSLANQYLEPISSATSRLGVSGLIATQSGCRAFLVTRADDGRAPLDCERFDRQVFDFLGGPTGPQIVLLARNWGGAASVTEAMTLVRRLLASGKTVVLILPLISPGFDVPERWMREQFRAGQPIDELKIPATPAVVQQDVKDEITRQAQAFAGNPRFLTVDLAPQICSGGYCYLVRGGQANFRDTLHIYNVNASQYNEIFAKVLSEAVQASRGPPPQTLPAAAPLADILSSP